jgi:hypothetical protein
MIEDFYTSVYNIYRNSGSIDSNGDYTETGSLYLSGRCKLNPLSGTNTIRSTDKGEVYADYRIYMAPIDITEDDNIVIGGKLYSVIFIANRIDNHLEIDALRIVE